MVTQTMLEQTGVNIDIIDGEKEAKIIAVTFLQDYLKPDRTYLYVDVGGGSTEFSFYENGKRKNLDPLN